MAIKKYKPYTPSRRYMTTSDYSDITTSKPEKSLMEPLKKSGYGEYLLQVAQGL